MPARGEFDLVRYFAQAVDLKTLASTLVIPALAGRKFLPVGALVHVKTLTGSFLTAPILRLGNNGTHDNVAPLLIVGLTLVVGSLLAVPLVGAASLAAIDIGSTGISLEVQTAAVATTMTADVHLWGIML